VTKKVLVAQLYCPICGAELHTGIIDCLFLCCTGCAAQWQGDYAIEQVNIAVAELTDWQVYDYYGEYEVVNQ
jgi:hypothetical protein